MLLMQWLDDLKEYLNPEQIVKSGGVWILAAVIFAETGLLIGFFLPGDSLLFVTGLFYHTNPELFPYSLPIVILIIWLAAVVGNTVGYEFGALVGPKLFKKEDGFLFKRKYLNATQAFYDKHGRRAIILGRFVPIVRTFVPILAGAIKMNRGKFFMYNILGATLWVPSLIVLGYLLGSIKFVRDNIEFIILGLIIVTIIPVISTYLKERKKGKAADAIALAEATKAEAEIK